MIKSKGITSVAINPLGRVLAAGTMNGEIALWDLDQNKCIMKLSGHDERISCVAFSPVDQILASASDDGYLVMWNVNNGRYIYRIKPYCSEKRWIHSICFSKKGGVLACGFKDMCFGHEIVVVCDVNTGRVIRSLCADELWVESVSFSPLDDIVGIVLADLSIAFWDPKTETLLGRIITGNAWDISGCQEVPLCGDFSPHGFYFATGDSGGSVKLWDVKQRELVKNFSKHDNSVDSIDFSPDGRIIVSCSCDQTAKLWDVKSGCLLHTLRGHTEALSSVSFSPCSKKVASGSLDSTVKLWDVDTGHELTTLYL